MLTFSRAQKGKPRAVDLAALTEDAVRLLGSSLPSSVELRTELEPGLPAVMIDPVQVEQILLNLCINARDAMPQGGRIGIRTRIVGPEALPEGQKARAELMGSGEVVPAEVEAVGLYTSSMDGACAG